MIAAMPSLSDPPPFSLADLQDRTGQAETLLRSLASRHRLMILCNLHNDEMPAGELVRRSGLTQSNLSRHLAMLRHEGLVATRREGTVIFYRIAADRVRPILDVLLQLICHPLAE